MSRITNIPKFSLFYFSPFYFSNLQTRYLNLPELLKNKYFNNRYKYVNDH